MKASEIRELTKEEREAKLMEKKEELFKLRFQHSLGQLENNSLIRKTKRDIARLLTIMGEKGE
jgi:large subunit ribosomal protein L29